MADDDEDDDDEHDDDELDDEEEDAAADGEGDQFARTAPGTEAQRRRRGATAAAGGQGGGPAKKKARSAKPAEIAAIAAFVSGTIRITADGKVALFAVGDKSRVERAANGESLLAVYDYLAAVPPPTGTFQTAIDNLPPRLRQASHCGRSWDCPTTRRTHRARLLAAAALRTPASGTGAAGPLSRRSSHSSSPGGASKKALPCARRAVCQVCIHVLRRYVVTL